ncbi:MAG: hypothetical protein MRZ82_01850 [Firmicutes bacterium]|nr:hypothetical protein [Bacillota bacterium]
MKHEDTINLLKECNAGVKMGVDSIDDVLGYVQNENLKQMLTASKEEHQRLGSELHRLLNQYDESGKEPSLMAKSMSRMKTSMKMAVDQSDSTAADLMTDGCNMGVKFLNRYLNQYQAADETSKNIAKELICMEEQLTRDMRPYL